MVGWCRGKVRCRVVEYLAGGLVLNVLDLCCCRSEVESVRIMCWCEVVEDGAWPMLGNDAICR